VSADALKQNICLLMRFFRRTVWLNIRNTGKSLRGVSVYVKCCRIHSATLL